VTLFDVTDMGIVQRQLEDVMTALKESAIRDGLTGIYNRRHLEERLAEEFARYQRYGSELSILLFDLDHFKRVNDQHGHLAGDAVLRATASRIAAAIRTMDVFARYGGEEFMLILPETGLGAAMLVAEKVRKLIGVERVDIGNTQLQVTASVGACAAHAGLSSYEALIRGADSALYGAKAQGRNRSVQFDPPA
jgi:diguanylate cyclase (GGDEF)-like protein